MNADPTASLPFHLWLVEDNRALRESLTHALARERPTWIVSGFPSCESAMKGTRTEVPEVVLMDIGLPGMSGLEGIGIMRERWPSCEVIVFTVFDDAEKIFTAVCAGASGYLLKSETTETVIAAIEEVQRGGASMHPLVARKVLERLRAPRKASPETLLSDRERHVLQCMSEGLTKKEIAARLDLSIHTVDNYLRRIYRKLHVNTMQGALARAMRDGLL